MGNISLKNKKRNYHKSMSNSRDNHERNESEDGFAAYELMQWNNSKERHVSMQEAMSNESISTDENVSKDSKDGTSKPDGKIRFGNLPSKSEVNNPDVANNPGDEKDNSVSKVDHPNTRPKQYNNTLMSAYPLGLHKVGERYFYNFWAPESLTTMKDFIEVHAIPLFELSTESKFFKYCNENGWYNTAEMYRLMWESVRMSPTRILFGVRSKFDIHVTLSDCFVSSNGLSVRAYSILGGNKMSILRAFNYLSDSWNSTFHLESMWHHDSLFQESFHVDELPVFLDNCGEKYANVEAEDTPAMAPSSNANAVFNGNQKHALTLGANNHNFKRSHSMFHSGKCQLNKYARDLGATKKDNCQIGKV